jgi:hypothetical protein
LKVLTFFGKRAMMETDGTKRDLENRFRDGLRDHSNEVIA